MKLKKLVQAMVVTCGVLMLGACASGVHDGDVGGSPDASAGNGGAAASGVSQNVGFGEDGGPMGGVVSKRTYYFDYDKSDVHESDKPAIFANADYLVSHASAKVIVEGHTDPRGSREYNVALGERRANAVAELMKSKGVSSEQIRVVSYGAERLAAAGRSEHDYQMDRRAVVVYTHK